jgi:hypothetical protein
MTVVEFLKQKNLIIREVLGIDFDLVPEDQLEERERRLLFTTSDGAMCPYCVVYFGPNSAIELLCIQCPMHKAGNNCNLSPNSTYRRITKIVGYITTYKPIMVELVPLIRQYNKELLKEKMPNASYNTICKIIDTEVAWHRHLDS